MSEQAGIMESQYKRNVKAINAAEHFVTLSDVEGILEEIAKALDSLGA